MREAGRSESQRSSSQNLAEAPNNTQDKRTEPGLERGRLKGRVSRGRGGGEKTSAWDLNRGDEGVAERRGRADGGEGKMRRLGGAHGGTTENN